MLKNGEGIRNVTKHKLDENQSTKTNLETPRNVDDSVIAVHLLIGQMLE